MSSQAQAPQSTVVLMAAVQMLAQGLELALAEIRAAQAGKPPDDEQEIGTPEAADLEGVTSETIRRWCETGELAGSKSGPGKSARWKTTRRFLRERRERMTR